MKKILIITLSLSEKNGLGRYSRDLIKRLHKNYKLIIFSGKEDTDFEMINCRVFKELPGLFEFFKLRRPLIFLWSLLKIIKFGRQADIIHSFMDYPHSFLASIAALLLRKPLFITAHGTYSIEPFKLWPDRYFHKFAIKRAKKIICISKFTEQEIKKRIKISNTVVINDGIDFKKFSDIEKKQKEKENSAKIILGVGILKARKGFHVSIPAIAEVKKKYPNIKYYIIGYQANKKYFKLLKKLVQEYSLKNNVIFLEKVGDKKLVEFYSIADLFVLTPINIKDNFEGFGLVYLEAGACGKPVIGTYDCGAEDAVIHGKTGLLVPQNNIKKTAKAILELLDNPKLAEKMGKNGRKRAEEMDWKNMAKKYIKVYEEK